MIARKMNIYKMIRFFGVVFMLLYSNISSAKTYTILVGVEDYQTQKALTYAVDDAILMYDILGRGDNKATTVLLLDKKATKKNVLKYMAKISAKITPEDILIFYFAGHGTHNGILCYDKTFDFLLTYKEIKSWLRKCNTTSKMIFLDSCSAANLFISSNKNYDSLLQQMNDMAINGHKATKKSTQFALFLSSDIGETSYELDRYKHGIFTFYLARGLLGKADTNLDGNVDVGELYIYVRNKTFNLTKFLSKPTQCPLLIGNFDKNVILTSFKQ